MYDINSSCDNGLFIYNDKTSTLQKLLEKDESASIYNRNLQILATDMYKVTKGLSPKVFTNTFTPRNQTSYNLRHITCFKIPLVNSVYNGTESPAFLKYGNLFLKR